jgi:general L-amino acid transport system permease protein
MTDVATAPPIRPPVTETGLIGWLRQNLFSTWYNCILTFVALYVIVMGGKALIGWALLNATFIGTPEECRAAGGACWAVVSEKHHFMLFGTYPYEEAWRPATTIAIFIGMVLLSTWRRIWGRALLALWVAAFIVMGILMRGGILGLPSVPTESWGGLPLTLMLSSIGIIAAFPLGLCLALGRRSDMPIIKAISVAFIELVRGVPLISVLFMASVMFPLFLPEGITIDKLLRAQVGIILFAAAYIAEAVRGGLQAVPKGQFEAAEALGLSYWKKMRLIILPQALRIVIPPLVGIFIGMFKDTSLVLIIGLYDLLNAVRTATIDPNWRSFTIEAYIFAASIFFVFCYFMSKYSQYLERVLGAGKNR